ncbi:hypothetical protein PRIPAC_97070 [Pristionchus pacificus]|uniref:Uncharacterized protein n=1 Tax=Pristionchus pacificus TaxID=54126 RepID=A0A454Y636_PRIPA|nr:hypothetical protein PRIPAC_97070 [Pristionchus pacificus]|eukprot:PDM84694.1 hypothetical protein PRIPAC_33717 [Pristionchus pacificus]
MQLLSLLALPLVAASYGQNSYPQAAPAYPQPAAAAPAYGAYPQPVAAAPVFFPVIRPWGRPTLDDAFQGPKIRAPISNPFFVPRFRGEHHLHRDDYGHRWGSEFPRFRHHHHHHHDDDFFGGHRHHHHHFVHQHQPDFVGVPTFVQAAAPAYPQASYPQPAYPQPAAAAPAGNYY